MHHPEQPPVVRICMCVRACVSALCYKAALWHAILQCQRFCRVSAISHTSWKMSDPGTKHTACDSTLQRRRKAAVGDGGWGVEGGLTQPTRWPLKMTVKWLTYLTNAIVWRVCFSSIFPRSLTAKLLTRRMFTYHARSEKKNQTDHRVLVGLAAFCHTYLKRRS